MEMFTAVGDALALQYGGSETNKRVASASSVDSGGAEAAAAGAQVNGEWKWRRRRHGVGCLWMFGALGLCVWSALRYGLDDTHAVLVALCSSSSYPLVPGSNRPAAVEEAA